jgi:hypothetical protein
MANLKDDTAANKSAVTHGVWDKRKSHAASARRHQSIDHPDNPVWSYFCQVSAREQLFLLIFTGEFRLKVGTIRQSKMSSRDQDCIRVNRDVWIQSVPEACSVTSGKSDHMDAVFEGQNEEAPP